MKRHRIAASFLTVALGAFLVLPVPSLAKKPDGTGGGGGTGYDVVVLAPLGTETYSSTVGDLNEVGELVGSYEDDKDVPLAFYYDIALDEYVTLLGGTIALGINNQGNIVGGDWDAGAALYWHSPTAAPDSLAPLPGDVEAFASDLNDDRMACGRSFDAAYLSSGVAWWIDEAGTPDEPISLPPLPGDDFSLALRIAEAAADGTALITGFSGIKGQSFSSETAVVWSVGLDENNALTLLAGPTGLGTLSGGYSLGYAVNNNGDVCGESENWPFLATAGSTAAPLPGPSDAQFGSAGDLNESGQIVGEFQILKKRQLQYRAMLWDDGQPIDLSKRVSLGRWERLENASEISNAGLIAGDGTFLDFESEGGAYLLIPK